MAKTNLTAERLKELLHYNPDTGVFTRRKASRGKSASSIAGTNHAAGYRCIVVDGIQFLAHRLAWLYMTGEWPKCFIDHKDCVKNNNRWTNLRDVSFSENSQNEIRMRSHNKNGFMGVRKNNGGWMARITVDGEVIYLGTHKTPEIAEAIYVAAKKAYHLSFSHHDGISH